MWNSWTFNFNNTDNILSGILFYIFGQLLKIEIKFTILKCTIQHFLSIFTSLSNHHHYLILEHFCHPKKKTHTRLQFFSLIHFLSLWIGLFGHFHRYLNIRLYATLLFTSNIRSTHTHIFRLQYFSPFHIDQLANIIFYWVELATIACHIKTICIGLGTPMGKRKKLREILKKSFIFMIHSFN